MNMPETIFAVLIGLATLGALALAARMWGQGAATRHAAMGWFLFAGSGLVQVVNLLSGYSLWLAILTTLGMLAGLWMARTTMRRVP